MVAEDIAKSLVEKWGSARAALDHATAYGEKAGRKSNWLKILETMATDEERAESPDGSVPKNFSHIPRTPKVPVGASVTEDHIVCLVDGTPRRHLASYIHAKFGMTPDDYRRHFDLPNDYPMVAPTSARKRPVKWHAETTVKTTVKTNWKPSFLKASTRRNSPSLGKEEAQSWIDEWGSAREALRKAMVGRDGPGRKPDWLKKLEELADEEQRLEVKQRPADQYEFAHISRTPAVPISKSLVGKHIICLVDGAKKTFLTRYLLAKYGMTPQDYRIHFGLPSDYPMTATAYRDRKSELAVNQGLGRGPKATKAKRRK
ncbi:MucR family transcriptional regulator [Agrobacterium salinitolerans]|nr:MucR family transcriptional regulator [Agrobacterium salinitolerans]